MASFAAQYINVAPVATSAAWSITDIESTLDDESGQVQLIIDLSVTQNGPGGNTVISGIIFQVTILSKI
jgi:hypothetical protein